MDVYLNIAIGILLPFFGTSIGASTVFFLKNSVKRNLERALLGFASGVMIAASIWSLLLPSIELAQEQDIIAWIPASVGFILGVLFLMIVDYYLLTKNHEKHTKHNMVSFAVTLHNIPEGMAVGVAFAAYLASGNEGLLAIAFALTIGIAIQNFPEGAIISLPLKAKGKTKKESFYKGVLSGIVEPIASLLTILLTTFITPLLPYFLAFSAGAMIYVVAEELIPEAHEKDKMKYDVIGLVVGFIIMMILDVALG